MRKLNPQGLARRDKGLMSCIVPDHGWTTVSIDLASGEPTVTTEFSKDPRYRYACFDGVGKAPYWDGDVLMISDIYVMVMSVSPIFRDLIRDLWNRDYNGKTFAEQWLEDCEYIQKVVLKKERAFAKILCLGLGYGMGPKNMVEQARNAGHLLTLEDARKFHKAYWKLFAGVRRLAEALAHKVKMNGWIVNPFGYRLTCEPRLGFNYMIQSSVSGIMHVFCWKVMAGAPWARFVSVIHDELIVDVPTDRLEEFKAIKEAATDSLNEDLGWSVAVRTGWAVGNNWYEAK